MHLAYILLSLSKNDIWDIPSFQKSLNIYNKNHQILFVHEKCFKILFIFIPSYNPISGSVTPGIRDHLMKQGRLSPVSRYFQSYTYDSAASPNSWYGIAKLPLREGYSLIPFAIAGISFSIDSWSKATIASETWAPQGPVRRNTSSRCSFKAVFSPWSIQILNSIFMQCIFSWKYVSSFYFLLSSNYTFQNVLSF